MNPELRATIQTEHDKAQQEVARLERLIAEDRRQSAKLDENVKFMEKKRRHTEQLILWYKTKLARPRKKKA